MKRDLSEHLAQWKNHRTRKPLILRGARQVGKSWMVQEFGKSFTTFVQINFEKEPGAKVLFAGDLQVPTLLDRLALYAGKKIQPGDTLLFLDEVQDCEAAITALRYFKEELPALHVIAAGSLLDFALDKLGLPVGRVQFLYLYPLSFGEFLAAIDRTALREHILSGVVDPAIHPQLIEHLKTYYWLGGMPAVVQAWLDTKDPTVCQELQDEILTAFKQDFAKYARRRQIDHVTQVFDAVPMQLGKKFQFAVAHPDTRSEALRNALLLLERAGIVHLAYHSAGQGLPLGAMKNERRFKVFFFDMGLAQRLLGLRLSSWVVTDLKIANVGPMAEQFVAQEFVAYSPASSRPELYHWHREAQSSNAEVDLLVVKDGHIVPVEVKSGMQGGLKSMHAFLASHPQSTYGLKISEGLFSSHSAIHEIPLYGIEAWLKGP